MLGQPAREAEGFNNGMLDETVWSSRKNIMWASGDLSPGMAGLPHYWNVAFQISSLTFREIFSIIKVAGFVDFLPAWELGGSMISF